MRPSLAAHVRARFAPAGVLLCTLPLRIFERGAGIALRPPVTEVHVDVSAVVITASDKGYAGERVDTSGPLLAEALRALGTNVIAQIVLPDDEAMIAAALVEYADRGDVDLIMTTGGTGAAPRDRTPEATLSVIERQMPGLAEVLRFEGYKLTPQAVLSRGVAGIRGRCLIVNLPGSPRAVREDMAILAPILPHAMQMLRGEHLEHGDQPRG
ncbi:MAG: MogA/MoaB family molybdenum cofactor biosynthesis protein [Anaerolineae bacterium]